MRKIAAMVYHRIDDNVLETCLKSLRAVSDCQIVIYTDDMPKDLCSEISRLYEVEWRVVAPVLMRGQRSVFKVIATNELAEAQPDGTQTMVSDVDTYFLKDPFEAFAEDFDLGVTSRGYDYWIPINAGIYFYRISDNMRRYLEYMSDEVDKPSWGAYVKFQTSHRHQRYGRDWSRGQDFLNTSWICKDLLRDVYHIKVKDVGYKYNYCPGVDVEGDDRAKALIRQAYKNKSVHVLHLKSSLKQLVYEDVFDLAVTRHPKGHYNWEAMGK